MYCFNKVLGLCFSDRRLLSTSSSRIKMDLCVVIILGLVGIVVRNIRGKGEVFCCYALINVFDKLLIKESQNNGIIRLSLRANPATSPEETTRYQLLQCSRHCVLRLFRDASQLIHTFSFFTFLSSSITQHPKRGFTCPYLLIVILVFFIICPVLIECR